MSYVQTAEKSQHLWEIDGWEIREHPENSTENNIFKPPCLTAIFTNLNTGQKEEWTLYKARQAGWNKKKYISDVPEDVITASLNLPIQPC